MCLYINWKHKQLAKQLLPHSRFKTSHSKQTLFGAFNYFMLIIINYLCLSTISSIQCCLRQLSRPFSLSFSFQLLQNSILVIRSYLPIFTKHLYTIWQLVLLSFFYRYSDTQTFSNKEILQIFRSTSNKKVSVWVKWI